MGKKEEFEEVFKVKAGKEAQSFKESKDFKGFAEIMNKHKDLRDLFRAAVEENAPSEEEAAMAGLGSLFGPPQ